METEEWEECFTDEGEKFYYNVKTGLSLSSVCVYSLCSASNVRTFLTSIGESLWELPYEGLV
jgi:hypothetical protein